MDASWDKFLEGCSWILGRDMELSWNRSALKIGISCKLTDEELVSVMKHFENDGAIDGTKFSLWFYRLRFETKSKLQSDLISYNRKMKQAKVAEDMAIAKEADDKIYNAKVDMNYMDKDNLNKILKV